MNYDGRVLAIHRKLSKMPLGYLRSLQNGTGERMDGAVLVPLTDSVTYCLRKQSEAVDADLFHEGMPICSVLSGGHVLWYSAAESRNLGEILSEAEEIAYSLDQGVPKS